MKGMMRDWVGSKYVDFRLSHAITIWYMKNLLNWCVMKGIMGERFGLKYVDFRLVHAITIWYMNNLLFWCVTKGIVKGWVGLICRFHAIPCHHYLTHEKPANLVCYKGDNGRVR